MIVAVVAAVAAAVRSDRVVACLRTRKSSLDDPLHSLDDDAHYASYGERTSALTLMLARGAVAQSCERTALWFRSNCFAPC